MTTLKKSPYSTVKVVLDDGRTIQIKRCPAKDLETFLELMEALVKDYIVSEGSLLLMLAKPETVSNLETVCSLLPVAGKEDEFLSYSDIQENWEQLVQLFFNRDLNAETRESKALEPGKIASLHFFPHIQVVQKALQMLKQARKEEEEKETSAN